MQNRICQQKSIDTVLIRGETEEGNCEINLRATVGDSQVELKLESASVRSVL